MCLISSLCHDGLHDTKYLFIYLLLLFVYFCDRMCWYWVWSSDLLDFMATWSNRALISKFFFLISPNFYAKKQTWHVTMFNVEEGWNFKFPHSYWISWFILDLWSWQFQKLTERHQATNYEEQNIWYRWQEEKSVPWR